MLFSVGTKVRFKHTGDLGEVMERLGGGMVNVYLAADDMEIPTFEEDLVRSEDFTEIPTPKNKLGAEKKKQTLTPEPPLASPVKSVYTHTYHHGIQLAFDPVVKSDGMTEKYHVYLINDTQNDVIFTTQLSLKGDFSKKSSGKLKAISIQEIAELKYDQLNDYPEIDVECWKITTSGSGSRMFKNVKIKPKQFFNNILPATLLNKSVHLYTVFEKLENANLTQDSEDLKSYTKRNVSTFKADSPFHLHQHHNVKEFAEFKPEIDLHIENLITTKKKMTNAEILKIQLNHFDIYLAKAIRLGVSPIFIIHGLGKGRLKDEIATRLIQNPDVTTFKNDYHPKYGWGATEVEL